METIQIKKITQIIVKKDEKQIINKIIIAKNKCLESINFTTTS